VTNKLVYQSAALGIWENQQTLLQFLLHSTNICIGPSRVDYVQALTDNDRQRTYKRNVQARSCSQMLPLKSSKYRGADKSLARPTSRCILFHGENISFDASLVIFINCTNIPPIMIINRIYEQQNILSL